MRMASPPPSRTRPAGRALLLALSFGATLPASGAAQAPKHLQVSALPALNYDSDEGFGYGAIGGLYGTAPGRAGYRWAFEPTLFFTTGGRREVSALADVPEAFGGRGRVTGSASWERECCYPYYGLGNTTPYDPALASQPSEINYYTYRRARLSGVLDLQWRLAPGLRVVTGVAAVRNASASRDSATRFFTDSAAGTIDPAATTWSVGPRAGIVYDTRDHERDPLRGVWLDALVWQGATPLGSVSGFTRLTGTARVYVPLVGQLHFAGRVLGERVWGDMPVTMLSDIGSSFRGFTGVGGAKSVRGVLRNRYLGTSRALANLELRWRTSEFRFFGQTWRVGTVVFVDGGRVWPGGGDIHLGTGGGLRLTWGEAFIVAADVATGAETTLQTYIGVNQLF